MADATGPARPPTAPGRRHLVLVGLPGVGKSTVGALVAERLGRPFLDFDAVIERRHGDSIASIFAQFGEGRFRELELALTAEVAGRPDPVVAAPGGGWVTVPDAVALLRGHGVLVYLRASPTTALRRLGSATAARPLLAAAESPLAALERLLAERGPRYAAADHVVDTDGLEPWRVAERVVQLAAPGAGVR